MKRLLFSLFLLVSLTVSLIAFAATKSSEKDAKVKTDNCKMEVCHKGQTITINCTAFPAHFSHGDMPGACN